MDGEPRFLLLALSKPGWRRPGSSDYTSEEGPTILYETFISQLLTIKGTSDGEYHVVGFRWWEYYDQRRESADWGLVTPRDDPYDISRR